jgi:stage V sporulation protein SpoVS
MSGGFGVPAGRLICALYHHYRVELHNFAPNAISQAAVFVAVCEGYLGIPAH